MQFWNIDKIIRINFLKEKKKIRFKLKSLQIVFSKYKKDKSLCTHSILNPNEVLAQMYIIFIIKTNNTKSALY